MKTNPVKLLFNLSSTTADIVKKAIDSGVIISKDNKIEFRKEICAQCEHLDKNAMRCKLCGCFMKVKVNFEAAKCPINKG